MPSTEQQQLLLHLMLEALTVGPQFSIYRILDQDHPDETRENQYKGLDITKNDIEIASMSQNGQHAVCDSKKGRTKRTET